MKNRLKRYLGPFQDSFFFSYLAIRPNKFFGTEFSNRVFEMQLNPSQKVLDLSQCICSSFIPLQIISILRFVLKNMLE